mmetsp:Transcript_23955/g.68850  ORF Transcript_23955/g.68850 Transcript_23955/m.68850 type:complete len:237 (+) Transcript_23955:136-846(+)
MLGLLLGRVERAEPLHLLLDGADGPPEINLGQRDEQYEGPERSVGEAPSRVVRTLHGIIVLPAGLDPAPQVGIVVVFEENFRYRQAEADEGGYAQHEGLHLGPQPRFVVVPPNGQQVVYGQHDVVGGRRQDTELDAKSLRRAAGRGAHRGVVIRAAAVLVPPAHSPGPDLRDGPRAQKVREGRYDVAGAHGHEEAVVRLGAFGLGPEHGEDDVRRAQHGQPAGDVRDDGQGDLAVR